MAKLTWKPGTMVYPVPAVMVSCGDSPENYNIITIAWTGTINTDPAMTYISVRKSRHSHDLIKSTGHFVINLTTESLAYETDFCGVKSGRDMNKFEDLNLTPIKAPNINAPMIEESPVCIECEVTEIKELGSHDMFLAKVIAVHVDDKYMDESGKFNLDQARPLAYSHGHYYGLGQKIGRFGYSVMKKKKVKERYRNTPGKKKANRRRKKK